MSGHPPIRGQTLPGFRLRTPGGRLNRWAWLALGCGGLLACIGLTALVFTAGGLGAFFALGESTAAPPPAPTLAASTPTLMPAARLPIEATVQIWAMAARNGALERTWSGSGSIISPDGYILTNAHVVLPDEHFPVDALQVWLTVAADRPPVPSYYAAVLQADRALDLAVIRISSDINYKPVNYGTLNLPAVQLGNSDRLQIGDDMIILGYPGIGGTTITLTSGKVAGFTSEGGFGERAFVKTSATIAGGNSGGLAANSLGELIGIPTQLGYGGNDQFVDCRVLADTNGDGRVDSRDACVPTGGFINALRPVNLALPLIERAKAGQINVP